MAVDMFLKIIGPDIKGETLDDKKKEEIDVLAWSWGASNSGTAHVGGGAGAGKANFQDVSVTLWFEKSTPELLKFTTLGNHIDKCVLTCRKAGGEQMEFIVLTMERCLITAVSFGGSGGEDRLTINVSINFGKFELLYNEQDAKGKKKSSPKFGYDIASQKA